MSKKILAASACIFIALAIGFFQLDIGITGRPVQTNVNIIGGAYDYNCSILLEKGWNLFSEPCIPTNETITLVLSSINHSYYSVHAFEQTTGQRWIAYSPYLPSWVVQNLSTITNKKGYFVNMTNSSYLLVNGTIELYNELPLKKGINLVGYPINGTVNISSAVFPSIYGSVQQIHAYNSTTGLIESFDKRNNSFNLTYISDGRGYWINVTEDVLWAFS